MIVDILLSALFLLAMLISAAALSSGRRHWEPRVRREHRHRIG